MTPLTTDFGQAKLRKKVKRSFRLGLKGNLFISNIDFYNWLRVICSLAKNKVRLFSLCLKSKLKNNFEGSLKGPFFYLGLFSIILLMVLTLSSGSILGFSAEENSAKLLTLFEKGDNLQNQFFILEGKKQGLESPDLTFFEENSIFGISSPLVVSPQVLGSFFENPEEVFSEERREIVEYTVQAGESLSTIAEKFNISFNTILWANDLNQKSQIKLGQKLVILPVSGILHYVKSGDTLSQIAQRYKGKVEEIINFNNLSSEGDIYIGDILIIPQGVMPPLKERPYLNQTALASSYFICPISSPCKITQGLHWYNAVDFSNGECGELVFAAAQGTVLKAKLTNSTSSKVFGGAGNHLTILHPNGVVTFYGHLKSILVNPGQTVSQGDIIGLVGGQPGTPGAGKSTGCHLHLGVIGAKNPFSR